VIAEFHRLEFANKLLDCQYLACLFCTVKVEAMLL